MEQNNLLSYYDNFLCPLKIHRSPECNGIFRILAQNRVLVCKWCGKGLIHPNYDWNSDTIK